MPDITGCWDRRVDDPNYQGEDMWGNALYSVALSKSEWAGIIMGTSDMEGIYFSTEYLRNLNNANEERFSISMDARQYKWLLSRAKAEGIPIQSNIQKD